MNVRIVPPQPTVYTFMIINLENTLEGFQKSRDYLLSLSDASDPELLKESILIIFFRDLKKDTSIPKYDGSRFLISFKYPENFPARLIKKEFEHCQSLLGPKIRELIKYLKDNPFSKRAIINVWSDSQKELKSNAECLIYIMFRKTNNGLDMDVHMIANDASSKALLNFHIFAAIHGFISGELNENIGEYRHLVDSYHIYKI